MLGKLITNGILIWSGLLMEGDSGILPLEARQIGGERHTR